MAKQKKSLVGFGIFLVLSISLSHAQAAPQKPKLVVLIAVDQFRNDYLTRFEHLFLPAGTDTKPGGFLYLMKNGAFFPAATTAHAANMTGPGHATMLTGAFPYLHGIISNFWFEKETQKPFYCAEDPSEKPVTSPGKTPKSGGRSPKTLLVTTVGDELKNLTGGKSRVVSVALKDRAAILMGGHRADLALWYDHPAKAWSSSTYYLKDAKLPAWLEKWNTVDYSTKVPEKWTKLLPDEAYALSTPIPPAYIDIPDDVHNPELFGKKFPHVLGKGSGNFIFSPWAAGYALETAMEAVKAYKLGADAIPDLLAVSISSHDYLGHTFGLMSEEMQDTTLREDRMIADFLAELFKQVPGGSKNVLIVLTADHGVGSTLASHYKDLNLPGGAYWPDEMVSDLNAFLLKKFSFSSSEKPVTFIRDNNVYLNAESFERKKLSFAEGTKAVVDWLRKKPYIAAAYSKEDLLNGFIPPTLTAKRMASNTRVTRSGDIVFAAQPGYTQLPEKATAGVDHENVNAQDGGVPLIFVGSAFKPGRYFEEARLNDLAPTLSAVLGISPPSGSEGRILDKILRPSAP